MPGSDLYTGSLDLLILKAVSWGPLPGYAIGRWARPGPRWGPRDPGGCAVPRAPPPGAARAPGGGMGRHRHQSGGEVLPIDPRGPEAAPRGDGPLAELRPGDDFRPGRGAAVRRLP